MLVNLEAWCKHSNNNSSVSCPSDPALFNYISFCLVNTVQNVTRAHVVWIVNFHMWLWGEFNFSALVSVLTSHAPPCWVSGFIKSSCYPSLLGRICRVYITYCMRLKPVSGFNRAAEIQCCRPGFVLALCFEVVLTWIAPF